MRTAFLLALALTTLAGAQSPGTRGSTRPLAVFASRFLLITAEPLDDGVMVIADGKIIALGPGRTTPIPADAERLQLGDRVVTPGFIDLHHHASGTGHDINDLVQPVNPELRTLDLVTSTQPLIRESLAGGVTTTLFIPGSGSNLGGFGVLLKMRPGAADRMVLRELGAMKVAQGFNPERWSGDLGFSRMGMHDLLTETLRRGQQYAQSFEAHAAGQGPKPAVQADLEPLRAVFARQVPVIVHTAGARDCIATARMFQDMFDLWIILSHGCFNGHRAAAALAQRATPVNLGPRAYELTEDGQFIGIAAAYHDAGCRDLSLNTDAPVVPGGQLPLQAAMAVRLGLPWDAALRALTIVPAQQVGISDRVGALAVGKDADFLVTDGDPLDPRYPPERVFIEGELVFSIPGKQP